MTKLLVASLLALSATASAQPTPPTPPGPPAGRPAPRCTATGGVVFEEKLELEPANAVAAKTWTITVYAGGAWQRRDLDETGKHPGLSEGCLTDAQLATIKAELAKATWRVTQNEMACAAVGFTFTSYSAFGKPVWAAHTCQTASLDAASAKALQTIAQLVEQVTTPHAPPCCKK